MDYTSLSLDPDVGTNCIQVYCNLFRTIDGRENRKYCYSSSSIDLSEKSAILVNQVSERLVRSISDRFRSGSLSLARLFAGNVHLSLILSRCANGQREIWYPGLATIMHIDKRVLHAYHRSTSPVRVYNPLQPIITRCALTEKRLKLNHVLRYNAL